MEVGSSGGGRLGGAAAPRRAHTEPRERLWAATGPSRIAACWAAPMRSDSLRYSGGLVRPCEGGRWRGPKP
jgi:hypothetical protein